MKIIVSVSLIILMLCNIVCGQWPTSGNNIYNSNTGNVGIGTSTPAFKLDIAAPARIKGALYFNNADGYPDGETWANFYLDNGDPKSFYFNGVNLNQTYGTLGLSGSHHLNLSFSQSFKVFSKVWSGSSYNPTQRMLMISNGDVAIGDHYPGAKLDVKGKILVRDGAGSESVSGSTLQFVAGYAAPLSGRVIFGNNTGWKMNFSTFDAGGNTIIDRYEFNDNGRMKMRAAEPGIWFNDLANDKSFIGYAAGIPNHALGLYAGTAGWALTLLQNGNIGINTLAPNINAKLDVNGNIYCNSKIYIGTPDANTQTNITNYSLAVNGNAIFNKVKVKTYSGWPDYVFEEDYDLMPLQKVASFIKKNKHLPGVPAATEVEKEGVDVGDTQAILLRKIEELTLYVIELDKKVAELAKENAELRKQQ